MNGKKLNKIVSEVSNNKYCIIDTEYKGRKSFYTFLNKETGFKRKMIFENFLKNFVKRALLLFP